MTGRAQMVSRDVIGRVLRSIRTLISAAMGTADIHELSGRVGRDDLVQGHSSIDIGGDAGAQLRQGDQS